MTKSYYISPVFKGKGKDRKEPGNYRPVSLISNPCKIFASILNSRIVRLFERKQFTSRRTKRL